jgi:hypothetical protein
MNAIREHESNPNIKFTPGEEPSATFCQPGRSADRLPMVLAGVSVPSLPAARR